jgi:hypothetical protein
MSVPSCPGSSSRFGITVFLLALTACGPQGPGTEALREIGSWEERDAVLRVSDSFFQALSDADTATLSTLLTPGAVLHSIRRGESGPVTGVRSREDFLAGIGSDTADFLERVWEPIVLVEGHVATVWTPYDFHIDGEFSHCGTDVVTLLRLGEGWRITGLTYDVVTEGCPPSPLGPPRTQLHPDMPQ